MHLQHYRYLRNSNFHFMLRWPPSFPHQSVLLPLISVKGTKQLPYLYFSELLDAAYLVDFGSRILLLLLIVAAITAWMRIWACAVGYSGEITYLHLRTHTKWGHSKVPRRSLTNTTGSLNLEWLPLLVSQSKKETIHCRTTTPMKTKSSLFSSSSIYSLTESERR